MVLWRRRHEQNGVRHVVTSLKTETLIAAAHCGHTTGLHGSTADFGVLPVKAPCACKLQKRAPLQAYIAIVLSGWNLTIYYCLCLSQTLMDGSPTVSVHCTD